MEVPMGQPQEDVLEDPMDEEKEEGPMFEEPIEIEESKEDPMEEHEQGGQEGAGDPDDGDDSDDSDSDGGDGGGDGNGGNSGDGGDGGDDGGDDGNGGDEDHDALLAQGWTMEIHYNLEGDAYYHPSFSHLYIATTLDALFSTGRSVGPTLTTLASRRQKCTSMKGLGCATSTVPSLHGSHVQPPSGMLLDRHWWSTATATSTTLHGRRIVIFPAIGVASPSATLLHHLERQTLDLGLP